jgi:GNAT superfamily N-acetyltransferase
MGGFAMDGPRPIQQDELAPLGELIDTVFLQGTGDTMFRQYPLMFDAANLENLFVFSDQGRIVSHVGMTMNAASIRGCTVQLGCIGAVATDDGYRGQGLATQLLNLAYEKAEQSGADFMMISGGRGLYLRQGATEVGLDWQAEVNGQVADRLSNSTLKVVPFEDLHLSACIEAYRTKAAHFLRPHDVWTYFRQSGFCMMHDAQCYVIEKGEDVAGYFVIAKHVTDRYMPHVLEFAGLEAHIAGSLASLMACENMDSLRLHGQSFNTDLLSLLGGEGANCSPVRSNGTVQLLNPGRLLQRLKPFMENQVGHENADMMSATLDNGVVTFWDGPGSHTMSVREATRLIFGHPEAPSAPEVLQKILPIPGLWYGLNFV